MSTPLWPSVVHEWVCDLLKRKPPESPPVALVPTMSGAEGQSRTNMGSPPNRSWSSTLVVLLHHTTSQVVSFRNPNSGNSNCNFPILALFAFSLSPGGPTYSLPVYSFDIESGATTGHDGIAKSTSLLIWRNLPGIRSRRPFK